MKAATYHRYGSPDVVTITEVPRPGIGDTEILVQVSATSVTTADWRLRAAAFPGAMALPGRLMFGLFKPKNPLLGNNFAGHVVARGEAVKSFKLGDAVFGFAASGAHAEYVKIDASGPVVLQPETLGPDQAAAIPFGGLSALVFLRDFAKLRAGERILIGGASGGVGVFAVQIAKDMGAEVTAVASGRNSGLLRDLGADHVVDYKTDDPAAFGPYDVILDTAGTLPYAKARRMLTPTGRYVPLEFSFREIWQALTAPLRGGRRVILRVSTDTQEDLTQLRDMAERGALRPVIDSTYPLDAIAKAHAKVETRHASGAVIVTVDAPEAPRQAA